MADER
jgi:hypothetical protein